MYERSYGYKYNDLSDDNGYVDVAVIAKAIRADIKLAVSEGLLPAAAYSVQVRRYSGGQSIDLTVRDFPGAHIDCDGGSKCHNVWCAARNDPAYAEHASVHRVLSAEAEAAKITLERIHGAYNHDGSETQVDYFDVRYYGHVSFEDASTTAWRQAEKEKQAAKRAALDAAAKAEVRKVANHSRTGVVVHAAVEVDGKLKFLCGAPTWRGGFRSFTDRPLSCSRCVKKVGEKVTA